MNFTSILQRLPTYTLVFVILFTLAFFLFAHEGLNNIDDFFYSHYAYQLQTGTFPATPDPRGLLDSLKERYLVFAPVALLYWVFGINIYTTTLWPLVATIGSSILAWVLFRRREPIVAVGTILLLGLHYYTLDLARYLYPDNLLMLWVFAAAAALYTGRQPGRSEVVWGAFFALFNFAALLSKETIIYYAPFYLVVLVWDMARRQNYRFWLTAVGLGGVLLTAYLLYYQTLTGDSLYRIHLIERTNEFMKSSNYLHGLRHELLGRLTWQPIAFFVEIGLAPAFLLAGVAALNWYKQRLPPEAGFWLGLLLVTLACYWFGSTSLVQYTPITLLPRMTTPLLPPLCVAAGFGLREVVNSGWGRVWIGVLLVVAALWMHNLMSLVYGGLGLYFAGSVLLARLKFSLMWFQVGTSFYTLLTTLALTGSLALLPVRTMLLSSETSYFSQALLIQKYLPASTTRGHVFVNDHLARQYPFYYNFQVPLGLTYYPYKIASSICPAPNQRSWFILNLTTTNTQRQIGIFNRFPRRRLVAQEGYVQLYEVELEQ
ncbi:hypothetical protein H8B13_04135 [Hymenobacter sp. BT188]|nr:hypothetical protein [Hymenobacter sp. BT188]